MVGRAAATKTCWRPSSPPPPQMCNPSQAEACIDVVPKNPANFNVDNVRVVKIPGGGLHDSHVVKGMVLKRGTEGSVARVADAKVAVFAQGVDTTSTETKVGGWAGGGGQGPQAGGRGRRQGQNVWGACSARCMRAALGGALVC